MRLKGYLKSVFILGLILVLGVTSVVCGSTTVAHADETREIKLNVNSQNLVKGKSFSIYVYNLTENQTVTYRSTSPAVATVDKNGVVYANLVGTATILVTVTEGDTVVSMLPCKITIGPPAISVQFSRLELAMIVGQDYTLERIVQPLITAEVPKFSSFNKEIATVSAGGRVTALTVGETYIFAQIDNGAFAVCKVTIHPEGTELPEIVSTDISDLLALLALQHPVVGSDADKTEENADISSHSENGNPVSSVGTGVDFATFIKNLNAMGKSAENADSTTDDAN